MESRHYIKWDGGDDRIEFPAPAETRVKVKCRNGDTEVNSVSGFNWAHSDVPEGGESSGSEIVEFAIAGYSNWHTWDKNYCPGPEEVFLMLRSGDGSHEFGPVAAGRVDWTHYFNRQTKIQFRVQETPPAVTTRDTQGIHLANRQPIPGLPSDPIPPALPPQLFDKIYENSVRDDHAYAQKKADEWSVKLDEAELNVAYWSEQADALAKVHGRLTDSSGTSYLTEID